MPAPRRARTATTRDVTEINRTAFLDLLRREGPLSRADIRQRTGLGTATVERIASALLARGDIDTAGVRESGSPGRPSVLLRYVADRTSVLAVDVTDLTARARIVDLAGTVLDEVSRDFDFRDRPPSEVRLDAVLELVTELAGPRASGRVSAIGLTVPGVVHEGVVPVSNELDWHDVPLRRLVAEATGLPVIVENDANATAYGEWSSGSARGVPSAVALVLGAGLGAGILSEGALLRGAGSAAGEIGFLLTSPEALRGRYLEEGDLEARLSAGVRPYGPPRDRRIGPAFRAMMREVERGDARAAEANEAFLDEVALTCGAIAAVIAPQVIVLAGAFAQWADAVAAGITERLTGRIPRVPRILVSTLGFDAAITGISLLTIEHVRTATYLV